MKTSRPNCEKKNCRSGWPPLMHSWCGRAILYCRVDTAHAFPAPSIHSQAGRYIFRE